MLSLALWETSSYQKDHQDICIHIPATTGNKVNKHMNVLRLKPEELQLFHHLLGLIWIKGTLSKVVVPWQEEMVTYTWACCMESNMGFVYDYTIKDITQRIESKSAATPVLGALENNTTMTDTAFWTSF
jgi:hypothetical protein